MSDCDPIQIESTAARVEASAADKRLKMPQPLGVRLIAVADVGLPGRAGSEGAMDHLYVGLLGLVREEGEAGLVYQSESFRLCFAMVEGLIVHETYRAAQIEVTSLAGLENKLVESEIEYTRQRGVTAGTECLVLMDPSGNWLEITDRREVR
ncbi:MAG: hypothetical protein NTU53_19990 [Planctomycetota bacterium]|nr:hypothetical protein [Planctomycetota bacterium]